MKRPYSKVLGGLVVAAFLLCGATSALAKVDGVTGTTFNLMAMGGFISTGDAGSHYFWGYAEGMGMMTQYPGPTLVVNQGDLITVNLTNGLPPAANGAPAPNVSIVFPGQQVIASGGTAGLLTQEAPPDGMTVVTYTFTATNPGTYQYHSGTRPEVEVEMGLFGALIVRPAGFNPALPTAYGGASSAYSEDREYLFLLSEIDPRIHDVVRRLGIAGLQNTNLLSNYFPYYWFINGRNAPDTMLPPMVAWLPTQPYNSMPMAHPGDRVLMRVIGGGRDPHPFHFHGNHAMVIARDGRMLETVPGSGDLGHSVFTIQSVSGETVDAIWQWTGEGLGWDVYGHCDNDNAPLGNFPGPEDNDANGNGILDPAPPTEPNEYAADHCKPFPVTLPEKGDSTFGGSYAGTPFLGRSAMLPPLQGGLNPDAGYVYMWHSHTEKELTNWDIFPGGLMTMMMVLPPWVPIMEM